MKYYSLDSGSQLRLTGSNVSTSHRLCSRFGPNRLRSRLQEHGVDRRWRFDEGQEGQQ